MLVLRYTLQALGPLLTLIEQDQMTIESSHLPLRADRRSAAVEQAGR